MQSKSFNKRFHNFVMVLYEEDETHKKLIDKDLQYFKGFDFAYIKHDKDEEINESGETVLKKSHYHVVLHNDDAKTLSSLAHKFQIKENYILPCKNYRSYLRYLIHFDDPDKYQYSKDDVISNWFWWEKAFSVDDEGAIITEILEYIKEKDFKISRADLLSFVLSKGFYATYRRSYSIIRDIISEYKESVSWVVKKI